MQSEKNFPNGFDNWLETHHDIVAHLISKVDNEKSAAYSVMEKQGSGGLYELGEIWTDEFEALNEGREWDGDYFEAVMLFVESKETAVQYTGKPE